MNRAPLDAPLSPGGFDFSPVTHDDLPRLRDAVAESGTTLWAAYPPFVLAYAASPARTVLAGTVEGSTVLLIHRRIRKQMHLDYLLPPLGGDVGASLSALEGPLAAYNGELETRMLWADLPVAAWCATNGWRVEEYEREYIYSREQVLAMNGPDYRMLRKRLNRCEREAAPSVREFAPGDLDGCVALLNQWQDAREELCGPVFDYGYTRAALEFEAEHGPTGVSLVFEVEGRIAAFAFGGLVSEHMGNFFLLKSDPNIVGLAETARSELIRGLEGCELVNDAGDLGREGLAQHKRMFRPCAFVPTWKAAIGG